MDNLAQLCESLETLEVKRTMAVRGFAQQYANCVCEEETMQMWTTLFGSADWPQERSGSMVDVPLLPEILFPILSGQPQVLLKSTVLRPPVSLGSNHWKVKKLGEGATVPGKIWNSRFNCAKTSFIVPKVGKNSEHRVPG